MEFSEVFGFLKILIESIKLLPKNGKFMASITILSVLLPSILFLLFSYFYQSLTNHMTHSIMNSSDSDSGYIPYQEIIIYLAALLLVEIAVLLVWIVITHLSAMATILVSATSYTGKKLSLQDMLSRIKRTWRRKLTLTSSFRGSSKAKRYASIVVILAALLVSFYQNPITIALVAVLAIPAFIFQLYSSVVSVLSRVVSIVEDSCEGREALEKAEQLAEGQRFHGFMLNLFFNLLLLMVFLGYWMILGDKGSLNPAIYGLFFLNSFSLAMIFGCIAYTVFYFQCKKYHGEEIDVLGDFQYTTLPNDTP